MNTLTEDEVIRQKLGIPEDNECYDVNWKWLYNIVTEEGWTGIFNRIISALDNDGNILSVDDISEESNESSSSEESEDSDEVFKISNMSMSEICNLACTVLNMQPNIKLDEIIPKYQIQTKSITFIWACRQNNMPLINQLLNDKQTSLKFLNSRAFAEACYNGYVEIVKSILAVEDFDPNVDYEEDDEGYILFTVIAVSGAAQHSSLDNAEGHVDIVKLLINDSRYDLNEVEQNTDGCLINAAYHHQIKIIDLLLDYKRFNSAIEDDILDFCINDDKNCPDMLSMLLNDPRINPPLDPSYDDNSLIRQAFNFRDEFMRSQLVSILLKHPKVNSTLTLEEKDKYSKMLGG